VDPFRRRTHPRRDQRGTKNRDPGDRGLRYDPLTYAGGTAVATAVGDAFIAAQNKPGKIAAFSYYMSKVQAVAGVRRIDSWSWALAPSGAVSFTDLVLGLREVAAIDDVTVDVVVVGFPE
jgi:hypothetical protein